MALAVAYLASCSSGGSSSSNNGGGGSNGDAGTLQIIAPKIIYSKTASVSSGYVMIINPTATAVKNLHYSLSKQVGGGAVTTVDSASADGCSTISAYGQCNLKLNVAAGAVAGSLGISANNDSSLMAKLFKSSNQSATSATLPVGIEQAYYNSVAGADGIMVSYYHTVIAGVPYILVSGIVASDKAGSFNNVVLVDGNGNALPNQQLISGNVSSAQGSTFSVLLPVSPTSGISQTIKVQTRQIAADGNVTVVSTATAGNTLTTTSRVGIADMLPGAVYLTAANPEQTITFVNTGDTTAQLQSLIASNPNIEIVFSSTSLSRGGTTTATIKLKNPTLPATSGAVTLSYNNGKEQVKTAAVVEQNVSPQPNPNPSPSPSPTSAPIPPAPTAGLTAVLSPDNNFFTTTAIGTVSRQLTLTNTGNSTENNFALTLPNHFTVSASNSNSCTVNGSTISNSLTANGGSCNVMVTYANNTATSQASGNISIAYDYNSGTAATLTAAVNYKVTQSTANLSLSNPWTPYNFINIAGDNVDFATQIFTLYNSGDVEATDVVGSIDPLGMFSILSSYSSTIAAGTSSNLNLKFGSSNTLGAYSTSLTISYHDYLTHTATPITIAVTGSVSNAIAYLDGSATTGFTGGDGDSETTAYVLQFGTNGQITLTYKNKGNENATNFNLSNGTISSKLIGSAFSLVSDGCNLDGGGKTLAPNETCSEVLEFSPTAAGATTLPLNNGNWQFSYSDTYGNYTYNSDPIYFNAYAATISTAPEDGATDVSTSLNQLTIDFGPYIDSSSINLTNITLTANGSTTNLLASCVMSTGSSNRVVCTTSTGLTPDTVYTFQADNVQTTVGDTLSFSNSFTTANTAKYAYIGSYSGGVYKCSINSSSGALSNCTQMVSTIAQVEAVFMFNGKAYLSSGSANAIYLCDIDGSSGDLSNCNKTGSGFSSPKGVIVSGATAYVANGGSGGFIKKCSLNNDGSLSSCVNADATGVSDPQDLTISGNYLLIASNGNSKIVTCIMDSSTGLATSCSANVNPPSEDYQDVTVIGSTSYIAAGGGYLASCSYGAGVLSSCTSSSSVPGDNYEGLAVYNNRIYASSVGGKIGWCPLNLDGTISSTGCSYIENIGDPRGMSIN